MSKRSPLAEWIVKQCQSMIDSRTGKPITWRQASIQAGLNPGAISSFITRGTIPNDESCYKLAFLFSTAERTINPDFILNLADHRFDPSAPEIIPPKPEPLTDDEADAILAAVLGEELYELLAEMISTPQGREELKWHLRRVLGK